MAGVPAPRVVRVLPDVAAIDKVFDYLVPDALGDQVRVGTVVRVGLHGRRVGGWVVADGVDPASGITLRPLAKVSGWGPQPEVVDLASWAAWRWAGRTATFLATASAGRAVPALPRASTPTASGRVRVPAGGAIDELVRDAIGAGGAVLRLPPASDVYPVVLAACARGTVLVLAPSVGGARHLGLRLRRAGLPVAVLPKEWAAARAGGVAAVVGSRAAAWAPVHDLAAVVVVDEHDEVYQEERAPTWHARDVVIERARRAGAACVLVSPAPSLEALGWCHATGGRVVVPSRTIEREGWPIVDVVDRRREDPVRAGLYSPRLVDALRSGRRVVCVLNRKGRARLLACASCGEIARCERCDASVAQDESGELVCRRCALARPAVCQSCGATKLKNLRAGVARAREELTALANTDVVEVTGASAGSPLPDALVYVGTEAALHQVRDAQVVAFLDFDQELLAPRYRAAEQALALVVRAARLAGTRSGGGRVMLQTRMPHHEVVQAALHADPSRVSEAERGRREVLRFPPVTAMAAVSGAAAPAFVSALGNPVGIEVQGPSGDLWLVRAPDHRMLCDALAAVARPAGRLRIEVDPLRV